MLQGDLVERWRKTGTAVTNDLVRSISPLTCAGGLILTNTGTVSERSKPASKERMKTSHFEELIALRVVQTAQRRDESTQRELAAFNNDFGGAWLVPPAHCA